MNISLHLKQMPHRDALIPAAAANFNYWGFGTKLLERMHDISLPSCLMLSLSFVSGELLAC
jgi:hypothetical protein